MKALVVLLAVILVALILFALFLGDYVEYTDGGVKFNLPWRQSAPPTPPVQSDPLVVVTPPPTPTPEPTPEPRQDLLAAVEVTPAQLAEGTAREAVIQAGGNCLVVEMKNEYGRLNWNSQVEGAGRRASSLADEVEKAVADLTAQGELYLAARINCFRDVALAGAGVGGPLMTRGGNVWYDANGIRWVSPVSQPVRDYLTALCLELAALGFDEVVLECAGFPYFGETHVLATDQLRPEGLSAPVEGFLQGLSLALADTEMKLSLLVTEEMVTGADSYSGLTPELMARYGQRIWVPAPVGEGADYAVLLTAAGMDLLEYRLVVLGGQTDSGSWAVMEKPAGVK